jgi:hypothetical protein
VRLIKFLFLSIIIFTLSCGIPSFDYIDVATISSSSSSGFTFSLDLSNSNITDFVLYARYYTDETADFDDIDLTDTESDSEQYLKNLGYTLVTIIDSDEEEIEEFPISDTTSFTVEISPVLMTKSNGDLYTLQSNHKSDSGIEYSHTIGTYSDNEGDSFLSKFEEDNELESESLTVIKIEFAIVNKGLSTEGTLEKIESLPAYITTLELPTAGGA